MRNIRSNVFISFEFVCLFFGIQPLMLFCRCREYNLNELTSDLYTIYKSDVFPGQENYKSELFHPLSGPHYKKLSALLDSESKHLAEYGFPYNLTGPQINSLGVYYPIIKIGQHVYLPSENSITGESHLIIENFSMRQLTELLLYLYVEDNYELLPTDEVEINEDGNKTSFNNTELSNSERIAFTETQRPRYFLAFFVDIYRMMKAIYSMCQENSCATFFVGYTHLLATYTEVICHHLTIQSEMDVDGICPKLCRARSSNFIEHKTNGATENDKLAYSLLLPPYQEAVDVCAQIPGAVAGSCKITGRGIYDHEFRCQCYSSAYRWVNEPGGLLIGKAPECSLIEDVRSALWNKDFGHIFCNIYEKESFCSTLGTEKCLFEARKNYLPITGNGSYYEIVISIWPKCICKKGFNGRACERQYDPCLDVLDIKDASNLTEKLRNKLKIPVILNGNWLCNEHIPGSKCIKQLHQLKKPTAYSLGYKCQCGAEYTADPAYGILDNCKKYQIQPEDDVHEDVGLCRNLITSWSEWGEWTICIPECGYYRNKIRLRACLSDAGCDGNGSERQYCDSLDCTPLPKLQDATDIATTSNSYYNPSFGTIVTIILAVLLPIQLIITVTCTYLIYKYKKKK